MASAPAASGGMKGMSKSRREELDALLKETEKATKSLEADAIAMNVMSFALSIPLIVCECLCFYF